MPGSVPRALPYLILMATSWSSNSLLTPASLLRKSKFSSHLWHGSSLVWTNQGVLSHFARRATSPVAFTVTGGHVTPFWAMRSQGKSSRSASFSRWKDSASKGGRCLSSAPCLSMWSICLQGTSVLPLPCHTAPDDHSQGISLHPPSGFFACCFLFLLLPPCLFLA